MALIITEEQKMLKDSAAELLKAKAPVNEMRALRDQGYMTFDSNLWREIASLGWTALTIPERYNGLDFGHVGLGQILEETGRNLSKSPLISSILLGASALRISDNKVLKAKIFPGLIEGSTQLTLALQEGKYHKTTSFQTKAVPEGENYVIDGTKTMVIDGTTASHFVVVSEIDKAISIFLVKADLEGVNISKNILMDSGTYADITFDKVVVSAENKLNIQLDGSRMLDELMTIAYSGVAAELLGICQEAFEITIQYLKERSQFGVIIGTYQALQHRAAIMFSEIELCKSIVLKALQAIDEKDANAKRYAHLAKAKLGKTVKMVTNEAIQMHGGIGVTDDANIGFYLKRARVAQQLFGDYNYHVDQLAALKGF
ncbi:acyl-CoA/acyl-ACP dehydrogenase [Flavobacteriaceae bacterium]|jgi:alkylation response protein AidB-like acyl-CoA dehydrogenase|nr:acyl-CoA dehydrogenase [Flavobacteriaceae bacterium]MBT4313591.1 acyl-CoA dehydrogenase [Flavobacteriaceae bacterium]MBT5091977.1 acyl-CoA dehydrogenase [Flavobacteriaceae bacterium]MBT5282954.1 acyl-CoA dehydrogenase [Flavobacteriaceae bacterium]MBT5446037.1 acyl-CoA dehydrogenase [Flavobacteriaceae bacterium]|tara:strand:+ start:3557 stop:4675 length:1119 start_codon:yes stop_codon:yes gene_type:complete